MKILQASETIHNMVRYTNPWALSETLPFTSELK